MTQAILDKNFIATTAGDMTVYNFDGETREFIESSDEYLAVGVGIPANSCTDAPGAEKQGYAICRTPDLTGWEYVVDHRGETVYITENGESVVVSALGDYPEGTTTLEPSTPYDKWDGNKWVTDLDAQHVADVAAADEEKQIKIDQANEYMNNKQWPGKAAMGRLKDSEKEQYNAWLDYLDELEVVDTSNAPDIIWPEAPQEN